MKKKPASKKPASQAITGDGSGETLPEVSGEERTAPAVKKPKQVAIPMADLESEAAERVKKPYRHPESNKTVAFHLDGKAYTATGIEAGEAKS